jgi:LPS-assembly protein
MRMLYPCRNRKSLTTAVFAVLAVFMVLALPGLSRAADQLRERMETLAGSKTPVEMQADRAEFDRKTGVYKASGNVRISQGDITLTADDVVFDTSTGQAKATGRVTLADKENVVLAESMTVNFDTSLGVIEKGNIFVKKENYHIVGDKLERLSENEYRVQKGSLTTCDASTPFWRVTADDIDVRMDRDVTAKNVVMHIKEIPVLYTPYAWFPLLKPRTTGLLMPAVGFSTSDGIRMMNSLYWAPLDNFDATFTLDYRSRRGIGLGTELRWAYDKNSRTRLYGYYMDDHKDKRTRYNLEFRHRQVLFDKLVVKADMKLSDKQFFKDLADSTLDRTQRTMDSNLFVTYPWDNSMAYLFEQYSQGLDINSGLVVQRLPEIGYTMASKKIDGLPLYLDAEGSATYFYRSSGISGGRYDLFPKVSGVFDIGGLMVLPRVGYRETVYTLPKGISSEFNDERGLFGSGVTVQTELSRLYTLDGGFLKAVKHTIEPKFAYDYVQVRGGNNTVKFDGIDTLGRRSMAAYSLANRFVFRYENNGEPRYDYLTIKLSQFYDFYRDTLVQGIQRNFSCLYGEFSYAASYGLTLDMDCRYNVNSGRMLSVNTDIRYDNAAHQWHAAIGHRYSEDTDQSFISPSRFDFFTPSTDFASDFIVEGVDEKEKVNFLLVDAGAKLPWGWSLSGKIWYDLHSAKLREEDVSVRYDSQCWALRFEHANRPSEKTYMVILEFKGMGNVKL